MFLLSLCGTSSTATTGSTVAASCVFLLFRIPTAQIAAKYEPVLYLSVPFVVILIVWLILEKPFSGLWWVKAESETT